ncbi:MAG: hypothetical protein ACYDHH_04130 [Solirubrobacteraceae bacterium]
MPVVSQSSPRRPHPGRSPMPPPLVFRDDAGRELITPGRPPVSLSAPARAMAVVLVVALVFLGLGYLFGKAFLA